MKVGPDSRRAGLALAAAFLLGALLLGNVAQQGVERADRSSTAGPPLANAPWLSGGVDVGETDLLPLAAAMRAVGLTTLQVSHEATLREWDRASLDFAEREPGALRARLRAAREAGLSVMLVLRVRLDPASARNRHLWHGLAWPRDVELDAFFAQYREYVLWAADLAAQEGVALLVVGNELNALTSTAVDVPGVLAHALSETHLAHEARDLATCAATGPVTWHDGGMYPDLASAVAGEHRALRAWGAAVAGPEAGRAARLRQRRQRHEDHWRTLLDEARAHFPGLLSYGAGFDTYADVGFWDATDAIVSTAYFGLRRAGERGDFEAAWKRHLSALARVAEARPSRPALPVYLGELGFTRRAGSAVRPWSYEGFEVLPSVARGERECVEWARQPLDPSERVRALDALASVIAEGTLPTLRGFSLWKLTLQDEHFGLEPYAIRLESPADPAPSVDAGTLRAVQRLSVAGSRRLGW
jgi:hypothetical protein